jgi:hypothetical protein
MHSLVRQAVADNAFGGVDCAVEETVVVQEENPGGMVIFLVEESLKVLEYSMRSSVDYLQSEVFVRKRRFEEELLSVQVSK